MFGSDDDGLMVSRKHKRVPEQANLKLTSMIDMFIILLVFLLKSFSASGDIMTVSPDLKLPDSTAEKEPIAASVIEITQEWVLLDGKKVASISEVYSRKDLAIRHHLLSRLRLRLIAQKDYSFREIYFNKIVI